MKHSLFLIALLFLFTSFSNSSFPPNEDKAINTINGFYDAMTAFDFVKMSNYCTSDFSVIDNGKYFKNLRESVDMLKTFEGAKFKIDIDFQHSEFDSKTELIIAVFDVDIKTGDKKMHIKAIESYTMKRVKGKWLIHFVHSTPIDEQL